MSAVARIPQNRRWLFELLGPELLDVLREPLTADQHARIDKFLDEVEAMVPLNSAVMNATDEDLPAVVERLLAERVTR